VSIYVCVCVCNIKILCSEVALTFMKFLLCPRHVVGAHHQLNAILLHLYLKKQALSVRLVQSTTAINLTLNAELSDPRAHGHCLMFLCTSASVSRI
jgi:hypothetical protein